MYMYREYYDPNIFIRVAAIQHSLGLQSSAIDGYSGVLRIDHTYVPALKGTPTLHWFSRSITHRVVMVTQVEPRCISIRQKMLCSVHSIRRQWSWLVWL